MARAQSYGRKKGKPNTGPVRLHHSAYVYRDLMQTRKFYEETLGWPIVAAWRECDKVFGEDDLHYCHMFFQIADGGAEPVVAEEAEHPCGRSLVIVGQFNSSTDWLAFHIGEAQAGGKAHMFDIPIAKCHAVTHASGICTILTRGCAFKSAQSPRLPVFDPLRDCVRGRLRS